MCWPHLFEFPAAGVAEASQQIYLAIDGHFAQFDEALIWLQIGIKDFSGDFFGTMDHGLWRHGPHPAQLGVKADQARNVGFTVLERIYVALGGFVDEIPVEDLPAALLVKQPLGAELTSVVQPIRNAAGQAADSRAGEGGERGDDGGVHRCSPQQLPEVMTTGPDYYYDAGGRGASEIRRELRCPDR